MTDFATTAQIESTNRAAGLYFFEPDTLKFFGSRILSKVTGGRYFVTSEKRPRSDDARRYTLRRAFPCGNVETVGEFQHFACAADANRAARILAKFPAISDLQRRALFWYVVQSEGETRAEQRENARRNLAIGWLTGLDFSIEVDGAEVSLYALHSSHGRAWLEALDELSLGLDQVG